MIAMLLCLTAAGTTLLPQDVTRRKVISKSPMKALLQPTNTSVERSIRSYLQCILQRSYLSFLDIFLYCLLRAIDHFVLPKRSHEV